jgi:hypothetical protein
MKWLPVDSEEGLLTWEHGACQSCRIPDQEGMFSMGSSPPLDQLDICFDDTHAIANAGLLLAAALAERLGIQQAADALIDLGEGAGAAHPGPQAANPGSTRCWQVGMASTTPTCCAVAPARCWPSGHGALHLGTFLRVVTFGTSASSPARRAAPCQGVGGSGGPR